MKVTRKTRRRLRKLCEMPIDRLKSGWTRQADGKHIQFTDIGSPGRQLLYHERSPETKLLAVAHLDVVMQAQFKMYDDLVITPALDDRLGVWVILDLLPLLGFSEYDILFTDMEEQGMSTAEDFIPLKQYNWVFEFDRRGTTDVAMYQYSDDVLDDMIRNTTEMDPVGGSFSDISSIGCGCKAMNWSVGYDHEHTKDCYAYVEDTVFCAEQFLKFAAEYKDMYMIHDHDKDYYGRYSYDYNYNYTEKCYSGLKDRDKKWDNIRVNPCFLCGETLEYKWRFCPYCGSDVENQQYYET